MYELVETGVYVGTIRPNGGSRPGDTEVGEQNLFLR
jgi:hypothetical protein